MIKIKLITNSLGEVTLLYILPTSHPYFCFFLVIFSPSAFGSFHPQRYLLHIRSLPNSHLYLPFHLPTTITTYPPSPDSHIYLTMSVCIWELAIFFFPAFFSFCSACITIPPLAFGFGIYGMQPGIEKHFVHINRLSVSAFTWTGIKLSSRLCQLNQIESDQIRSYYYR